MPAGLALPSDHSPALDFPNQRLHRLLQLHRQTDYLDFGIPCQSVDVFPRRFQLLAYRLR